MNDEKEVIDEKLITEELLKDEKVQEYLSENEDDILEVQIDIEKTKKCAIIIYNPQTVIKSKGIFIRRLYIHSNRTLRRR